MGSSSFWGLGLWEKHFLSAHNLQLCGSLSQFVPVWRVCFCVLSSPCVLTGFASDIKTKHLREAEKKKKKENENSVLGATELSVNLLLFIYLFICSALASIVKVSQWKEQSASAVLSGCGLNLPPEEEWRDWCYAPWPRVGSRTLQSSRHDSPLRHSLPQQLTSNTNALSNPSKKIKYINKNKRTAEVFRWMPDSHYYKVKKKTITSTRPTFERKQTDAAFRVHPKCLSCKDNWTCMRSCQPDR